MVYGGVEYTQASMYTHALMQVAEGVKSRTEACEWLIMGAEIWIPVVWRGGRDSYLLSQISNTIISGF